MLNDVEYQGLIRMIGPKVENSVIRKASKLKIDVREYLKHSGYSFATDTQGNLIIRSCNGRIQIKPEAANAITISFEN